MIKKKLTRLSLEELSREMPILTDYEQMMCIGGKGHYEDPYTYTEYLRMVSSGTWSGGYVYGSHTYYKRDSQGYWSVADMSEPIHVDKDTKLLSTVEVVAALRSELTGNYADELFKRYRERYGLGDSDFWGLVDPIWLLDNESEGGGDGSPDGSIHRLNGLSWEDLAKALKDYRIILRSSSNNTADGNLQRVVNMLLKSSTFRDLLTKSKNHGVDVYLYATDDLDSGDPDFVRSGLTTISKLGSNYYLDVKFKSEVLNSNHSIGPMATIIHEMIHASLMGVFVSNGILLIDYYDKGQYPDYKGREIFETIIKESHPGLYDYYSRYPALEAEHEMMATHYRPIMKSILKELCPHYTEEVYEALSWAGLHNTQAWKKLEDKVKTHYMSLIRQHNIQRDKDEDLEL